MLFSNSQVPCLVLFVKDLCIYSNFFFSHDGGHGADVGDHATAGTQHLGCSCPLGRGSWQAEDGGVSGAEAAALTAAMAGRAADRSPHAAVAVATRRGSSPSSQRCVRLTPHPASPGRGWSAV